VVDHKNLWSGQWANPSFLCWKELLGRLIQTVAENKEISMQFSAKYRFNRQRVGALYIPSLLLLLLIGLSSGCAANKTPIESETNSQAKNMRVDSSHGSFELAPTVVSYAPETFNDPFESFNSPMFAFNDFMFRNILIPVGHGYQNLVPKPVRGGVTNFFSNIREPLNALNHVLQGNGSDTGVSVGRFLINSTIGLLGLFDPADA
jgi:phospholipid-binding lipoprotein MlaA